MKKTLFITTLLLSAGAMFTSCNKDVENPDMQAQPEETAQVTRAYGDKTPLIEVYYEINDTNPLNALSYEMNGKKFIDLVLSVVEFSRITYICARNCNSVAYMLL